MGAEKRVAAKLGSNTQLCQHTTWVHAKDGCREAADQLLAKAVRSSCVGNPSLSSKWAKGTEGGKEVERPRLLQGRKPLHTMPCGCTGAP
eukprot:2265076-Amphidinium_carterae.1